MGKNNLAEILTTLQQGTCLVLKDYIKGARVMNQQAYI